MIFSIGFLHKCAFIYVESILLFCLDFKVVGTSCFYLFSLSFEVKLIFDNNEFRSESLVYYHSKKSIMNRTSHDAVYGIQCEIFSQFQTWSVKFDFC